MTDLDGLDFVKDSRDVGITVLEAFECWHHQHGLRHMGEIELARGFQGLSGMTA